MKYWAIQSQEAAPEVFLPNEELLRSSHRDGINPVTVRRTFAEAVESSRIMQIIAKDGLGVVTERQPLPDLLFWSWVPIFSDRARKLAVKLGCEEEEFWPCRFESNPGDIFFMHLPERSHDVVDVAQSKFLMMIPMPDTPPIPHHIQSLVLGASSGLLPPCFRAPIPGQSQVFSELFVGDVFKQAWEQMGFTGALFRRLTGQ